MQKKSNGSITFPVALGGMNNIAPQDNLQNNQAVLLQNITYDETTKSFKGSKKYNQVDIPNYSNFNKIYEVIYNDEKNLLLVNENGFYDYNNKKFFTIFRPITDIVYNNDGVYLSAGSTIYNYKYDTLEEISIQNIFLDTTQKANSWAFRNLIYKTGRIYFTSWWAYTNEANSSYVGLGYIYLTQNKETENETNKIEMVYNSQNFTQYQGSTLLKDNEGIYIYKRGNKVDGDIPSDNLLVGIYKINDNKIEFDNQRTNILLLIASSISGTYDYKKNFGLINEENCYITTEKGSNIVLQTLNGKISKSFKIAKDYGSNAYIYTASYFDNIVYDNNVPYECKTLVAIYLTKTDASGQGVSYFTIHLELQYNDKVYYKTLNVTTSGVVLANSYTMDFKFKVFKLSDGSIVIFQKNGDTYLYDIQKDLTLNPDIEKYNTTYTITLDGTNKYISDVCQYNDKFYISIYTGNGYNIEELDFRPRKDEIPFMLINNGRLVVAQTNSLYYSGVGDFNNWQEETDADALFLEVGYKDSGNIIAGALTYGSIIVFKDNGYIYRVSGDYPNWSVVKIAETDNITSNIYNMGGTLLFGTKTGVKQINPTQVYGDFLLSDFQNNVIANEVTDISESQDRKTIIFCSKDYVIEYHTQLNIFYVYQAEVYSQMLEFYNNEEYKHYALKDGSLYEQVQDLNDVTVTRGLIHNEYNLVIKAITLYTDEIQKDTDIEIEFISGKKITRTLKQGQSKHKFFITVRLKEMQLKYIHSGDIFINNTIVEYSTVGA